jgi:predicted RNase H-like nuclease (RuvC/YqgF family)
MIRTPATLSALPRTSQSARVVALLALLPAALASVGCYLAADGKDLEVQVTTIHARQEEFIAEFEAERTRLTELALRAEENITRLQSALDEAQEFLQQNNANLGARVGELESQINTLRGRLEEAEHLRNQLSEEILLLRSELQILAGTGEE